MANKLGEALRKQGIRQVDVRKALKLTRTTAHGYFADVGSASFRMPPVAMFLSLAEMHPEYASAARKLRELVPSA